MKFSRIRYVTSSIFGNSWDPDEAYSTQTLLDQEPITLLERVDSRVEPGGRAHMEAPGNGLVL